MAPRPTLPDYTVEDAVFLYPNFAGAEDRFNREGDRNFCLIIPTEEQARNLAEAGWSVKETKPREGFEEEFVPVPFIKVKVSFKHRPPNIFTLTSGGRTRLTEDMVETVDFMDIKTADVTVTPSYWEQPDGRHGFSAYLKTMYIVVDEDPLDIKFANWGKEGMGD